MQGNKLLLNNNKNKNNNKSLVMMVIIGKYDSCHIPILETGGSSAMCVIRSCIGQLLSLNPVGRAP
jgi:hypothetical protein